MNTKDGKNQNLKEFESLFEQALKSIKEGKPLEGKDGAITPLIKKLLESSLEGEIENHLEESRPNRRNGHGKKKVKTSFGSVEINTPRDRESTFEPQILPKRQTTLGPSIENKIISLYSKGMSYRDICGHIEEMYGMELSPALITTITDKVWPEIEEWRTRPLDEVYPFVWLDALFYKVRQEGEIKKMAAYMVLGMNLEGEKNLLGIYLSETESANFWMQVLADLQERGVKDILVACIDNLTGFKEAINCLFPKTDVQLCIVHQIRNSIRYASWNEEREIISDMKEVYKAVNLLAAEEGFKRFEGKWEKKYPAMVKSWKNNWDALTSFYQYPPLIRKIMYTTNSIEGFHRQIRKATKTKGAFTSDRSLYKTLYLVSMDVKKRWSSPREWRQVIGILAIKYPERLKIC